MVERDLQLFRCNLQFVRHYFNQFIERLGQVAVIVQCFHQAAHQHAVAVGERHQAKLPQQVLAQRDGGRLDVLIVAIAIVVVEGPGGAKGCGLIVQPAFIIDRGVLAWRVDTSGIRRRGIIAPVAMRRCRRRVFFFPFEQRVIQQVFLQLVFEFDRGQLQ
ncbi:MAG: hypothetical protein AW09_003897 [Candidatus Accumulibacter phosphatis]|uniref:Uncharacterized protein n=1 Tax=Candidatus Accumulibacter phosphatis TaxID=327160 RepID=A0A080LRV4_9PROT|nr:MAG: hypothetical protein AW09_003897 [Candidatus Accumulibacter phosphatis]